MTTRVRTQYSAVSLAACVAITTLAFTGCGDSGGSLVNPLRRGGDVAIEIGRGTAPEFDWADGEAVSSISVWDFGPTGEPANPLWGYEAGEYTPPVKYGDILTGGREMPGRGGPPLRAGFRYRVQVTRGGETSEADWIVP